MGIGVTVTHTGGGSSVGEEIEDLRSGLRRTGAKAGGGGPGTAEGRGNGIGGEVVGGKRE